MQQLTRRDFSKWASLATGALMVGGCAPWEFADSEHALNSLVRDPRPTPLEWRILNRLGYGARPGALTHLRSQGVDAYVEQQLCPDSIEENPELARSLGELDSFGGDAAEARDLEMQWRSDELVAPVWRKWTKFGKPSDLGFGTGQASQELQQATILRAACSHRQLREVMVEFWTDHFNIDQTKGACRWLKTVDDQSLRQHALGKFRDLLNASVHSPAMLVYLDNKQNRKHDAQAHSDINENYARELLELHSLGDTSVYTLHDIQEVARCLTGYTLAETWPREVGGFEFRAVEHDNGEKVVLGHQLAAGQGQADVAQLLDIVSQHPSTATNIARKLCRHFLGGTEPSELVNRLATLFTRSDGDIRRLLEELLQSEEFRSGPAPQFKRPFQFVISALRVLGARTSGLGMLPYLDAMGQRPFHWSRPDGYPESVDAWTSSLTGRWKFVIDLVTDQVTECWINVDSLESAIRRGEPRAGYRHVAELILGAPLTDEAPLENLLSPCGGAFPDFLPQWLALLLMSPQFQWC